MRSLVNSISAHRVTRLLGVFVATLVIWMLAGTVFLLLIQQHQWQASVELLSGFAIAWGVQQIIGYHWFQLRPWVANTVIKPSMYTPRYSKSFPSSA